MLQADPLREEAVAPLPSGEQEALLRQEKAAEEKTEERAFPSLRGK